MKDITLWEEKNSTELPTKLENKPIFVQNDGINETKNEFVKKIYESIGNKKIWKRNCPKCGKEITHIQEYACQKFNKEKRPCRSCSHYTDLTENQKKLNVEKFIEKSNKVHTDNKYDYSKVVYGKNNTEKVIIICPIHGEFLQTPNGHLNGRGCPMCGNETRIKKCIQHNKSIFVDLTGKKFNNWNVIKMTSKNKMGGLMWLCRCDCGKEKNINGSNLKQRLSKNCGCKRIGQPYKHLYNKLKEIASRLKRDENFITFEDFLEFIKIQNCHYCNKEIFWSSSYKDKSKPYNIDRKDNRLGYSKENCVVCCWDCNFIKGRFFSYEEMVELGPVIKKIIDKRGDKLGHA